MATSSWRSSALGELLSALRDGTHASFPRTATGIPFLSAKNIGSDGAVLFDEEDDRISYKDARGINASFELRPGDILMTIVGTLGRRAIYKGEEVVFQRSVAYLRPNPHELDSAFLYHYIGTEQFQRALMARANATAQAGVYLGEVGAITVSVPNLPEQRRIASIMDSIDEEARETAKVVDKLKMMKSGVMADLLADGERRGRQ